MDYELEGQIDEITEVLESLDKEFQAAESFGDKRAILIEYRGLESEQRGLINCQGD